MDDESRQWDFIYSNPAKQELFDTVPLGLSFDNQELVINLLFEPITVIHCKPVSPKEKLRLRSRTDYRAKAGLPVNSRVDFRKLPRARKPVTQEVAV